MSGVQPKTLAQWINENAEIWNKGDYKKSSEFGQRKLVPFEDYKSVVDRLGQFYREVLSIDSNPPYVLPSELTERAVARIRTEFYRRFSEFFSVEKCEGGQKKK